MTSTIEIFPTHRQSSTASFLSGEEWSQFHKLTQPSSEYLMAETASARVAETGRDLSGGLPRQRSDTSYASKRTAIQRGSPFLGTEEGPRKFWREKEFGGVSWKEREWGCVGERDIFNACIYSQLLQLIHEKL